MNMAKHWEIENRKGNKEFQSFSGSVKISAP